MTHQPPAPHHVAAPRRARGARAVARHASSRGEGFGRFVGLTTLGALLPGVGLLVAGRRKAGAAVLVVLGAALVCLGYVLVSGRAKSFGINTAVDPRSLLIVAIVAIAGGLLWCVVIIATALAARSPRLTTAQRGLGAVLVAALCLTVAMPSAMAARYSLIQRDLIDSVFANAPASTVPGVVAPKTQAADPWAGVPRVNMLLIGSDYAPHSDRIGVRTDSIDRGQHRHQDRQHRAVRPPSQPGERALPVQRPAAARSGPTASTAAASACSTPSGSRARSTRTCSPTAARTPGSSPPATRSAPSLGDQARLLHGHRPRPASRAWSTRWAASTSTSTRSCPSAAATTATAGC